MSFIWILIWTQSLVSNDGTRQIKEDQTFQSFISEQSSLFYCLFSLSIHLIWQYKDSSFKKGRSRSIIHVNIGTLQNVPSRNAKDSLVEQSSTNRNPNDKQTKLSIGQDSKISAKRSIDPPFINDVSNNHQHLLFKVTNLLKRFLWYFQWGNQGKWKWNKTFHIKLWSFYENTSSGYIPIYSFNYLSLLLTFLLARSYGLSWKWKDHDGSSKTDEQQNIQVRIWSFHSINLSFRHQTSTYTSYSQYPDHFFHCSDYRWHCTRCHSYTKINTNRTTE